MTTVGLISDTHGLIRPEALDALAAVDRILHAGDVGSTDVLDALEQLAPVTAVRGNVDHGSLGAQLPETAELEVEGVWIHARHILDELDLEPAAAGFQVVVYGHSHRPTIERRGEVLYINPGSAGPRRFRLPVTLALLEIDGARATSRLVELLQDG